MRMAYRIWVRPLSTVCKNIGRPHNALHRCRLDPSLNLVSNILQQRSSLWQVNRRLLSSFQNPSVLQRSMDVQQFRKDALAIFQASVDSVYPPQMIRNSVRISEDGCHMIVGNREYQLKNNVYVVGFGKAVLGMARALEDLIKPHIVAGILSVPVGSQQLFMSVGKQDLCLKDGSKISVIEGAHNNMPDSRAYSAAIAIQDLIKNLSKEDILIVLISGGGSALLPCPEPPITLEDELELTSILSKHGASIQQLNILRQNIETLKGGGLARLSYPASTISLILSDVIDDKLDIIGSGPTVPLLSSPRQCLQILQALNVQDKVPRVIHTYLEMKAEEKKVARETTSSFHMQKYQSGCEHAHNVVIGSNSIATKAAYNKALELNYVPIVLTNGLKDEAKKAADMFVKLTKFVILGYGDMPAHQGNVDLSTTELDLVSLGLAKSDMKRVDAAATEAYNSEKGLCIICGGETTVMVTGKGKGGRNQEMALAFGIFLDRYLKQRGKKLHSDFHVEFLSAGTDGQDGPTEAAGAVVNENLVPMVITSKMNPVEYLKNNDSYNLFKALKNSDSLIECGLTGTNVMDVQILLIKYLHY